MPDAFKITGVVVGAERVVVNLGTRASIARERMRIAVTRSGIIVQNRTKFGYLSGRALNKRTGRLLNSINERTQDLGDVLVSTVGTALPYGRFWELGFHGIETVSPHTRRISSRNVFGRVSVGYARVTPGGRIVLSKRTRLASGVAFVRGHERRVDLDARPFLRPALEDSRANIREEFREAMRDIANAEGSTRAEP